MDNKDHKTVFDTRGDIKQALAELKALTDKVNADYPTLAARLGGVRLEVLVTLPKVFK